MMNGKILAYSHAVTAGVIQGHDGKAYHFSKSTWSSTEIEPANGLLVQFNPERRTASNVNVVTKS